MRKMLQIWLHAHDFYIIAITLVCEVSYYYANEHKFLSTENQQSMRC